MIRRTEAQNAVMANPCHRRHGGRKARPIAAPSKLDGARPDLRWCRRGCDGPAQLERSNHELLDALEWQHVRRGVELGERDQEVLDAMAARAWGWEEVQTRRMWTLPSWADDLIPSRRAVGYGRFLALVLAAYRAGALGVLMGYHECMALVGTRSTDTWRRWTMDMEERGLVRIVQTWRAEPTEAGGRPRCHAKLLYRLGPAWEKAGPGLCEGACSGDGGPAEAWVRRMAAGARARARAERDDRCGSLWERTPQDARYARKTAPPGSPIIGEQSPPDQAGGLDPAGPLGPAKVERTDPASPARAGSASQPATVEAPTTDEDHAEREQSPATERNHGAKAPARRARKAPASRSPGGRASRTATASVRLVPSQDRDAPTAACQPRDPGGITRSAEDRAERVKPEHVRATVAALLDRMGERGLPIAQGPPEGRAPPGSAGRGGEEGGGDDE
jgi:hypothetical protein